MKFHENYPSRNEELVAPLFQTLQYLKVTLKFFLLSSSTIRYMSAETT